MKESNTLCAKLLAEEIKDIDSKELLDKSDDSIYMYLYQRGWILSKRLNPKKIFLYVYINTNLENEILDPETLNKVIPLYLKSNNINLIDIINSWNHPYFLERKHIFNECIWAIENNMYFVAISTLLTQLEGVLYREFGNKVIEDNERGFWNVKRSLNYAFKEEDSSWRKAVHYILENDIYANFGESFLNNKGNSKFKSNTNRNEILHGLNTNYGDESSLVKIVILLDAIHDILKENL